MSDLRVLSLAPFIPSGRDYPASRCLFRELGFEETWEHDGYAGFRSGDARFILQNYHDDAFAQNLMVRIEVADLDAWWQTVARKNLDQTYPGFKVIAPKDFPWGREVNFIDLAGVCWHVAAA